MHLFRMMGSALALMGCAVLASCTDVKSVHPLSPPGESAPDERLIGVWKAVGEDGDEESLYLHVHAGRSSLMDFLLVWTEEGSLHTERFQGHVTRSRGVDYLNLRVKAVDVSSDFQEEEARVDEMYRLAKYELTRDDSLIVWHLSGGHSLEEAVKDGTLRGEREGSDLTLTDEPRWILRFLDLGDHGSLFEEVATFRRLDPH